VGDIGASGEKIVRLVGRSDSVAVYRNEKEGVQWETSGDELTPVQLVVVHKYDRLFARTVMVLKGMKRTLLVNELAQALFLALSEPQEAKALKHFDTVARELAQEAQLEARFSYVTSGSWGAFAALALGSVIAILTSNSVSAIGVGVGAGALGAWASILQRASSLKLGAFETPQHLSFQGVTRILIGMVFGVFAIACLKAGLLFSGFEKDLWITGMATFVAGFSERLIPELITRIESHETTIKVGGADGES
jgi:hypothetical protein